MNIKELKLEALKVSKRNKVRGMTNRAFSKLRTNFGFAYQD